jgi:hypothetical protein
MIRSKNPNSFRASSPSISDDESLNPKYSHLLNWLFWEEPAAKSGNLIRLKAMIQSKEKPAEETSFDYLRPLSIGVPSSSRFKTSKIMKNLTIQIPEENQVKNSLVFKEEGLLPLKNQVNIEDLLDIIEGKDGKNEKKSQCSGIHRRSLSERKLNYKCLINIPKFKMILKKYKSASAIDLVEVIKVIQIEMSNIQGKACYEVRKMHGVLNLFIF